MSDSRPKTMIVLPARLASSRLKEKLLQMVAGKTVLEHTYRAASRAKNAAGGVIVAVDDPRLADIVEGFGGTWVMTPTDCASGTDRIAAVARRFPETDVFVNVQSDEPEIDPDAIDAVAETLHASPHADIATAGTAIRDRTALSDPGIVKIVMANDAGKSDAAGQGNSAGQGRAVYFSRAPVPFSRDDQWDELLSIDPAVYWHHLGLYAYRRDFLAWFAAAPQGRLETVEKLEQLRAIEAGKTIVVAAVDQAMPGIDTPDDLAAFRNRMK